MYFLTFLGVVILIVSIVYLIIISKSKIDNELKFIFVMFSITTIIWVIADMHFYTHSDFKIINVSYMVSSIGWGSFQSLLLHLALRISNKIYLNNKKTIYTLIYFPSVYFIITAILFPERYTHEFVWNGFSWNRVLEKNISLSVVSIIIQIVYMIISLYIIYIWGKKSKIKKEKILSRLIVLSVLIAVIVATILDVIMPIFVMPMPPLAVFSTIIFYVASTYSILHLQFMEIRPSGVLNRVMDRINDMIIVLDSQYAIHEMSQSVLKTLGYEETELSNNPYTKVLSENISISKNKDIIVTAYRTSKNKTIPVELYIREELDKYNDVVGYVTVARNLTNVNKLKNEVIMREKAQKIAEKTTNQIKLLFDNANQGFLSLDDELKINPEYSKACVKYANVNDLVGKDFIEVFINKSNDEICDIKNIMYLSLKEEHIWKRDAIINSLPKEITINGYVITIEYKIILKNRNNNFMIVLTDITKSRELSQKLEKEMRLFNMIMKVSNTYEYFLDMCDDLYTFLKYDVDLIINESTEIDEAIYEIYRNIHTYKSNYKKYEVLELANFLDESEYNLDGLFEKKKNSISDIKNAINIDKILQVLSQEKDIITNILGKKNNNIMNDRFVNKMIRKVDMAIKPEYREEINKMIVKLSSAKLKETLLSFKYLIKQFANSKKIDIQYKVNGEEVYINKEKNIKFIRTIMHIFTNIISHGVKDDILEGKVRKLSIVCTTKIMDDSYQIIIQDDGKGIDINNLKQKLIENNALTKEIADNLSHRQLLEYIFKERVSIKKDKTVDDGRGMGLSAVMKEVRKLNGSINVYTNKNKGTRFEISIPF